MSAYARSTPASSTPAFEQIACDVFSLDPGIRWVGLKQAGGRPSWVWRDPETSRRYAGAPNTELIDPLKLIQAEQRVDRCGAEANASPRRPLFLVLAYADLIEIVTRLGPDAQVSVATDRSIDVYTLGARITSLLSRTVQEPLIQSPPSS